MSAAGRRRVHLFSQSRGKLAFDEATRSASCPAPTRRTACSVGACNGTVGLAGVARRGARGRREGGARRPARTGGQGREAEGRRRPRAGPAACSARLPGAGRGHDGQGLRRFPERRHRQGHPPRRARGHPLDRARQALHHQRHGDRPGQDVEHATAWPSPPRRSASRSRRSASPPSARPTRRSPSAPSPATRAGRLFDPTRTTPIARLGRGARRRVRGCRPVEARLVLPAGRRGHARRRRPRMRDRAHGRRHLRRLDARQDRGGRARTRPSS